MKIAYLLWRFPVVSETFIVRELDAVNRQDGLDVELFSLLAGRPGPVHPVAEPWIAQLRRPTAGAALAGLGWWLVRRPGRLATTAAVVIAAHARRPGRLMRALVVLPLATAHARTMATLGIDHVHAHWATSALAAWVIWRLAGIPYSFTAHAQDIYVDRSQLRTKIRDARTVITISEFNRRFLAPYAAGSNTPIEVVRCGIDLSRYRYRERELPSKGMVSALCVAMLEEKKGHRFLIEALADEDGPAGRLELTLVGGGQLREELEAQARALGVPERVRFTGPLPEHDVAARLDDADLFVLPSIVARDGRMEGLPNVLIEALACGVPAVATRISGIPELVQEGETGILAEPADPDSLRQAIERAVADPAAARRRARAGRRAVEEHHDLRVSAGRMASIFRRLGGVED